MCDCVSAQNRRDTKKRTEADPTRSPGKKRVTCSINAQHQHISKSHGSLCAFWKDPFLFSFCQPRLREAVKYNYGSLRCPPMSRMDSHGAEGTRMSCSVLVVGSCSITKPAYDRSMNRNSLYPDRNSPQGWGSPLRRMRIKLYIVFSVVSFHKTAKVQATFCQ